MKSALKIDKSGFEKAIRQVKLSRYDNLQIAGVGAKVLSNGMKTLVPVDTAATKASINSHIIEASGTRVVDDIGPETEYAPYLEYGTGEYAENGQGRKGGWRYKDSKGNWHFTLGGHPQPFVRPAAKKNEKNVHRVITVAFAQKVLDAWPK